MQNGLHKILSYVHGAIRLLRDLKGVTLWHVFVGKVFAICAVSHGNQTIKIILNAIFIRREMMMKLADRKLF